MRRRLQGIADYLNAHPKLHPVTVVGHTDDQGSEEINVKLSQGRAEIVRETLIKMGVAESRVRAVGAGSKEPLVPNTSHKNRRTNRRVEIWVPPHPVAYVSKIQRRVEEKDPASTWRRAEERMPLQRLSQVRTHSKSSSEINFPKDDRVSLGPNALVIIYGSPQATRTRLRRRAADISVKGGSILAELAKEEGRSLDVDTGSSRMKLESKSTRIDVASDQTASTVSVFDGQATVRGKGKRVKVPKGFGTRVEKGRAPEKPRPLPPPPVWRVTGPVVKSGDAALQLAWTPPKEAQKVELQVHRVLQSQERRLSEVLSFEAPVRQAEIKLDPGVYALFLVSVDDRGISGPLGQGLSAMVEIQPRHIEGGEAPVKTGKLSLKRPGRIRLEPPPGARILLNGQSYTEAHAVRCPIGRTEIRYAIQNPLFSTPRTLVVEVAVPELSLQSQAPQVKAGRSETAFQVAVKTPKGQPVTGLKLALSQSSSTTQSLEAMRFSRFQGEITPEFGELTETSTGVYQGQYVSDFDGKPAELQLTEPRWKMAARIRLPTAAEPVDEPKHDPSGYFLGLRGGLGLDGPDRAAALLGLELGGQIGLSKRFDLGLSAEGFWQRRAAFAEPYADYFSALGKAEIGLTLGLARILVSGGAGAIRIDKTIQPIARAGLGLSFGLGNHALSLEGGYQFAPHRPEGRPFSLGGPVIFLGYRLGTFWLLPQSLGD